jgi:xanthine dehydrogenase accessory factor
MSNLLIAAIERVLDEGRTAVLATLVEAPTAIGAKVLVEDTGITVGSLGDQDVDRVVLQHAAKFLERRKEAETFSLSELSPESAGPQMRILFERVEPKPRIVICGAGHVGAALAKMASGCGYHVTLIDDRVEFVTRELFPDEAIELVVAGNWTAAVRQSIGKGRGVSVAVVTRGHNEDEECMHALVSTDADYIGLIGSKRRTNIVLNRLREAGMDEEKLRRVRAPIGLDIGAVTPEEVALSILAEIVSERRGRTGAPLSAWRREEFENSQEQE